MQFSNYDRPIWILRQKLLGKHREVIGGMWDEIGHLQFDFLKRHGLEPKHKLLDIGCGSLRLGTLAVPYLDPGHYFGTDLNYNLMRTGHRKEIAYKDRLPLSNLVKDGNFSFDGIPSDIDFAIATSVFTHLPFNHLRRCLLNMAKFPNLKLFGFTIFLAPSARESVEPIPQGGGIVSHDITDAYHFIREDIDYLAAQTGFSIEIMDWNHPRHQLMCVAQPHVRP